MSRRPEDVRAAMAAAAELVTYGGDHTWRDVLFDGDAFSRPGDPDRALLEALTHEHTRLDAHADTLPERMHVDWLERILAIPRLPVVPDHVVAHATVDPKLAPVVIGKGTVLRGGKDAFGVERRYATTDALTAHGAAVTAVRGQVPGGVAVGQPGMIAEAAPFPLRPTVGDDAPHTLRIYSPLLAFEGGTVHADIYFDLQTPPGDPADVGIALGGAEWTHSAPDGVAREARARRLNANELVVTLDGPCGAPDGDPWVQVSIPATASVPVDLGFTGAYLAVIQSGIVPQSAYWNDSAIDVTKEFRPFGTIPRSGDAFYLRCDEAFGRPLISLTLSFEVMKGGTCPLQYPNGALVGPSIQWQYRTAGTWQDLELDGPKMPGLTWSRSNWVLQSEPTTVSGETGHFIRGLLEGDFGWSEYQTDMADFVTAAAQGDSNVPSMPTPPAEPVLSKVTVSCTTDFTSVTRVEATNGWAHTRQTGTNLFTPFTLAVPGAAGGTTGSVALGLALPDCAIGSSVSVYFEVESATPCGTSEPPEASWEWWNGFSWRTLSVADGTRQLRESGLLRFVAPSGWATGCGDAGDVSPTSTTRWLRMVTRAPDRLGVITAVIPDAVVAEFSSSAADPGHDPSSATALPPGTIKGTLAPITGVKKVTNLVGVRGRGPEDDAAYRRRASALARHRGRAITAWDYEEIVAEAFPEVAAVRCLPHTAPDGTRMAGEVGLVVIPDRPSDPQPRPSVSLSERITDVLGPMIGMHATPAVMCPSYVPVTVEATITLRRAVAALTGQQAIAAALEVWLHPTGTTPTRWGRSLYRSAVEAFLESLPEVDSVTYMTMGAARPAELVEVDACRGLYCSSGHHSLTVEEQL